MRGSILKFSMLSLLLAGAWLGAAEPFPAGTEGEIYLCPRIDLNPPADGGPLSITLDGFLDEPAWERAQFQRWAVNIGGRNFDPPEMDLDLFWAAVADDQFLYVAWTVIDEARIVGENAFCDVWMDDSVEVYIDALNNGPECPGGASCYGLDDGQLTIGANQIGAHDPPEPDLLEFGGVAGKGACDFTGPAPELLRGVTMDYESDEGFAGWRAEIAIALDTLGNGSDGTPEWHIVPEHGATIGWNIHVNDDDDGTARDHKLLWSKIEQVETAWQNPGAFGKIQFLFPGKALASVSRDLPDGLRNGGSGTVSITITPQVGKGRVVVNEQLPEGLVPSSPSPGGTVNGGAITWDLGLVETEQVLTYTLTVDAQASDGVLGGKALIDGVEVPIIGDTSYSGSPISVDGFIKTWLHLGPLGGGSCDPGPDLGLDWIANADGSIDEFTIQPFAGMVTRPQYGGIGDRNPGSGAKSTGLHVWNGVTTEVLQDRFPVWKAGLSPAETVDHASTQVHGFDAENQVTLSSVYLRNDTGAPIETVIGVGSDDSIQITLNDLQLGVINACRAWGTNTEEQDLIPVVLPEGESRLLVKVADGQFGSGFRLRFRKDPLDPAAGGLLPDPQITLSLESRDNPPPAKVARSFSRPTLGIEEQVEVSLRVTAPAAADVTLREPLPAGAVASGVSPGGSVVGPPDAPVVVWDLTQVRDSTVRYTVGASSFCAGDLLFASSTFQVGPVEGLVGGESLLPRTQRDDPLGTWTSMDIPSPGGAAQRLDDHGTLVFSPGAGVRGTADEFRFISQPQGRDFEVTTRIDCLDDPGDAGQAGLMVRDGTVPHAAMAFFYLVSTPPPGGGAGQLRFTLRRDTNPARATTNILFTDRNVTSLPIYLRLRREGNRLSFRRSEDGVTFREVTFRDIGVGGSQILLPDNTLAGLAVGGSPPVGSSGASPARASFREVSGPPFTAVSPLGPPRNLQAQGGNGRVDLSWEAPAGNPVFDGYAVLRGALKIGDLPTTQTVFSDTGLENGTEYCYTVRAMRGLEAAGAGPACARPGGGSTFRRGNVNGDSLLDISDAIGILGYLFLGQADKVVCVDAADIKDKGSIDISDAISVLNFLFQGGTAPAPPGPDTCGLDVNQEAPDLGCAQGC